MNEYKKLVNKNQRLQILNLEREKGLREANDTITNLYNEIIKLKEEKKNKLEEKSKEIKDMMIS